MNLTPDQIERYRRQLLLREIGGQGQQALLKARVLVVGAGGLGCPILAYLAGAGIGHLTIIDPDVISRSNLQRQFLYQDATSGMNKADIAARRLSAMNPTISITPIAAALTADNADALFAAHDLVIEGVDRYAARYLINQAAIRTETPWISSAIGQFSGQVTLFTPWLSATAPCYRCLVPHAPEEGATCEEEGVLGATCGVVGAQAAAEAIKFLTSTEPALLGNLLVMDILKGTMRRSRFSADPECPDCHKLSHRKIS